MHEGSAVDDREVTAQWPHGGPIHDNKEVVKLRRQFAGIYWARRWPWRERGSDKEVRASWGKDDDEAGAIMRPRLATTR